METKPSLSEQLGPKIMEGMRRSFQKLPEQRAAENGTLVFTVDGKILEVSARELLEKRKLNDLGSGANSIETSQ